MGYLMFKVCSVIIGGCLGIMVVRWEMRKDNDCRCEENVP